ncbi:hypothetical protein B296_00032316 [Ensete ventricosum]|uniref:Auxin-responsive protein n=1 Tax=Ensete ventricosum TaxID=4639 RepID=A0A426YHV4_ENSVE|nr:hypothetical protein B296_00032316 [Ensete ventricosum]
MEFHVRRSALFRYGRGNATPREKAIATWARGPASGAGSATCRRPPGNVEENDRNNQEYEPLSSLHLLPRSSISRARAFDILPSNPHRPRHAPGPTVDRHVCRPTPVLHGVSITPSRKLSAGQMGTADVSISGVRSPLRSTVRNHTPSPFSRHQALRVSCCLFAASGRGGPPTLTLFDPDRCFVFVWISILGGEMKRLIRRLSRVADSSHYRPQQAAKGGPRRVPEGYVPLCVGEEMERFAVRAELLGRPAFVELLRLSAQEYGYEQHGVLRIPCPVPLFCRLLLLSSSSAAATAADPALEELFRSLPDEGRSSAA